MAKNMEQQIGEMNDDEIQQYVSSLEPYTRHEEKHKWTMVYNGDTIKHWSYCKFIQWGISDKNVSNITITDALFIDIEFQDCVFDKVPFENCVFDDIILSNTIFKNSTFYNCKFDPNMVLDKSCRLYNDDDE